MWKKRGVKQCGRDLSSAPQDDEYTQATFQQLNYDKQQPLLDLTVDKCTGHMCYWRKCLAYKNMNG